jgi:hypothetical protein
MTKKPATMLMGIAMMGMTDRTPVAQEGEDDASDEENAMVSVSSTSTMERRTNWVKS